MSSYYVGIDLGTTESTISIIEKESLFFSKEEVIANLRTLDIYQYNKNFELDKNLKGLQSSLYIDRDNKIVYTGEYAKELYSSGSKPLNTIRSIKTRIGGESMISVPLSNDTNNKKEYDMTELSAILLKNIKNSLDSQIDGNIERVTITIPAGFDSDERNATLKAAELAGFKNVILLDEPTAVLLNLLNSESNLETIIGSNFFNFERNIVVYDIGGGTLDISIAKVQEDEGDFDVEIIGRSKRMEFGGDNIDKYIASYFLYEFEKINPSIDERSVEEQAKIVSRIVSNAEKHKISFNRKIEKFLDKDHRRKRIKESVNFEIIDNLKITDLSLTDELLKEILSPVISENGKLLSPLKDSLKSANLKINDIDLVILTGGSGKFYLVNEVLENFFKNVLIVDFTEFNAVSKGAAMHSYSQDEEELSKIKVNDIMSDSIYIKKDENFELLIPHNQIPGTKGVYKFKFNEPTYNLEVFLYYGSDKEEKWKYKEINGIFYKFNPDTDKESGREDNFFREGRIIDLEWEFDENKILKIFYNGKELVNSDIRDDKNSELLSKFEIR